MIDRFGSNLRGHDTSPCKVSTRSAGQRKSAIVSVSDRLAKMSAKVSVLGKRSAKIMMGYLEINPCQM